MRVDEVNPLVSELPARQPAASASPRQAAKHEMPVDEPSTPLGQLTLNGITAYYEVRNGEKIVYSLVDDATGRCLGEFSPGMGIGISAAIQEMLNRQISTGNPTGKGQ
jgi:hypothetical protein